MMLARHSLPLHGGRAKVSSGMRPRNLIIGILATVFLSVFTLALWPDKPEPIYKGRRLSKWAVKAVTDPDQDAWREAFEHIGTNGIPCYLDWLRYEPGWLKRTEVKIAGQCNDWLHLNWYPKDAKYFRAFGSYLALEQLGERAQPIIPQLVASATNVAAIGWRNFLAPGNAIALLAHLGPPAVPPLLSFMTNENPRIRVMAVIAARNCPDKSVGAQIRASLLDPDRRVRVMATNSLKDYLAGERNRVETP
jgi:hypothetical protein